MILDGVCEVAYEKVRPFVTGDGKSTTARLVGTSEWGIALDPRGRSASDANPIDWGSVPSRGERVLLSWRHNLGKGTKCRLLSETDSGFDHGRTVATAACTALGLRAASVDVFATNDSFMVLEANGGIRIGRASHLKASRLARSRSKSTGRFWIRSCSEMRGRAVRTPFIRDILQRLASRLGAEVRFHPDGFVGTIRFGSGAYSLFWDNKFNLNPVSSVKIAQDKFYNLLCLRVVGFQSSRRGVVLPAFRRAICGCLSMRD